MNHKRRRPKHQRAGCLWCKPHKDERATKRQRRDVRRGDWRYLAALPVVLVALTLSLLGCVSSQLLAADAFGRIVNADAPLIVAAYDRDCGGAIDHAPPGSGKAALAECRARWRPAWDALEALAAAQQVWVAAIKAGQDGDWGALLAAACDARTALLSVAPALEAPVLNQLCEPKGVVQ